MAVSEEDVHFLQHLADGSEIIGNNEPPFRFIFSQNKTHYFKHAIVEELDDSIGDIKSMIFDRQKFLMLQIEDSLLDAEPELLRISIIMATLDAVISLGNIDIEYQMNRRIV